MRTPRTIQGLLLLVLCISLGALAACGDDDCMDCGEGFDPPISPCLVDGVSYEVGETVPSEDCNTCLCSHPDDGTTEGVVSCTTMGCECAPEDCGPAPGMPNYLCDDGETWAGPGPCEMQENGSCGWTMIECPETPFNDCDGKACGDTCSPCDPEGGPESDPCPDTAVEWYCDASGACVDHNVTCEEDLCADVTCPDSVAPVCDGDELTEAYAPVCEPTTGECVAPSESAPAVISCEFGCADGACLPDPGAAYDPCEAKACGESCTTCDPADTDCMETAEEKRCNHDGECEGSFDAELCAYEPCEPGQTFDASDGCNTCTCPEQGYTLETQCTEKACSATCKSSAECEPSAFCDFSGDDCGVWKQLGTCVEKPQSCIAGGPGACGCDGSWATNDCELQAQGTDLLKYGGCQSPDPVALFACGDTECQIESEFCAISANDIAGPDQPEFYSSCGALPQGCAPGDCSCMSVQEWEACYDGTGYTMMFYPGG